MKLYYAIRCWLGVPVTYREYREDLSGVWWFARCKYCNRQKEVH